MRFLISVLLAGVPPTVMTGCTPSEPNPLDSMPTADVTIGEHAFRAWIADDD